MLDPLALRAPFTGDAVFEFSTPPLALKGKQQRGDVDIGSSSSLYGKHQSGRVALALVAFASAVAFVFLVSHCFALSKGVPPRGVVRKLAEEQETKGGDANGKTVQQVCGGPGSQSSTGIRRGRRPVVSSEADTLKELDEYVGEPPPKKRHEEIEGQHGVQQSTSNVAERASESAEIRDLGLVLRQSIMLYAEQSLTGDILGLEAEDWLLDPFVELQVSDEEEPRQSPVTNASAPVGHSAKSAASARTFGGHLWPGEGASRSAAPAEYSSPYSNAAVDVTVPSVDPRRSESSVGLQDENWLLDPFVELQVSDEEEPRQSPVTNASAPVGHSAKSAASARTFGGHLWPGGGASRSAAPAEYSSPYSNAAVDVTVPSVDPRRSESSVGLQDENWLLDPFVELQVSDEEEPRQSPVTNASAPVGHSAKSAAAARTFGGHLWPGEGASGSAAPAEEFPPYSKVAAGVTAPSLDPQFPPQGPAVMQPTERSSAMHGESPALTRVATLLRGESVSQQSPREVGIRTHPFYRLPAVAANAWVREFKQRSRLLRNRRTVLESSAMLGIKEILKKNLLNSYDLELLMENLEMLVNHALHRKKESIDTMRPKYIVEKLGFALLVTDAIYAASEVLGSQARRSEWWQDVIDTLPVYTGPSESAASRTSARQNVLLAQLLHSALEIYRCGSRPSAEVLVPLKQIILCTPAVPALRRGPWTQFTTDDIEWQQSQ